MRYAYRRCHMDDLQGILDSHKDWRVHTITHCGALVHVLFEKDIRAYPIDPAIGA